MKDLLRIIPQKGKLSGLEFDSRRKRHYLVIESVKVENGTGLVGVHLKGSFSEKRQITLIQQEHFNAVSSILGKR